MRSYSQTCGVAKGLDLIGDRWTLLIVREMLIRGGCRYTDLRNGLPGIATNLLAQRLRELQQAGLVSSEDAPAPVATTLFRLTERGEALEPVLKAIGEWARPALQEVGDDDAFQSHWLVLPVRFYVKDTRPSDGAVRIQLDPEDDEPIAIEADAGSVRARVGRVDDPDLTLRGPGRMASRLVLGRLSLDDARRCGLQVEGDAGLLERIRVPDTPATGAGVSAVPAA